VVRHDDGGRAVLACELRILRREQSFDDDGQAVAREPLEVPPAHRCVEPFAEELALHGEVLGHLEVHANVALTPAEIGNVDSKNKRRIPTRHGFFDQRLGLLARAPDVHLEPAAPVRELFGRGRRRRREAHDRAGRCGGACRRLLPVRMGHALHRQRCNQDGQGDLFAEDRCACCDGADVDEDPRSELAPFERGDVLAQRDLVTSAAGEVRVCIRVKLLFGETLVVPHIDRLHDRETNARVRRDMSRDSPGT
jgi:hypothetical protein